MKGGTGRLAGALLAVIYVLAGSCGGNAGDGKPDAGNTCVPDCRNRECGPDGCGGKCGNCAAGRVCSADWLCVTASDLPLDPGSADLSIPDPGPDPAQPSDPGPWDPGHPDPGPADTHEPGDESVTETPEPGPDLPHTCEPGILPIPATWKGTFEGNITSNIPDVAGYTFNGAVDGIAAFTLNCVDNRVLVSGTLKGGQTNCALVSGCPFFATVSGEYDPIAKTLTGELKDGSIDFVMLVVKAEGTMEGQLQDDSTMTGTWKGHKTDIVNKTFPGLDFGWVVADGEGTWEAKPMP
jgi:hypothetical protein